MIKRAFKRMYEVAALLALLHVVAAAAVIGALISSDRLNQEKAQQMVKVMRGELPVEPPPPEPEPEPEPVKDVNQARLSRVSHEIHRREAERVKTELEQKLGLVNSVMQRVTAERLAFQREREAFNERQDKITEDRTDEGFLKQVQLLESLSPKAAVQHLMAFGDSDEAARLLYAMEPRSAKKIIEAAKDGKTLARMQEIMQRMRDVAPADETNEEPGA